MFEHGGNVIAAAKQDLIPTSQRLDLSTGINPHGWLVPPLPPDAWLSLPQYGSGSCMRFS